MMSLAEGKRMNDQDQERWDGYLKSQLAQCMLPSVGLAATSAYVVYLSLSHPIKEEVLHPPDGVWLAKYVTSIAAVAFVGFVGVIVYGWRRLSEESIRADTNE